MKRMVLLLTVAVMMAASLAFSGLAWAEKPAAPGAQGARGLGTAENVVEQAAAAAKAGDAIEELLPDGDDDNCDWSCPQ